MRSLHGIFTNCNFKGLGWASFFIPRQQERGRLKSKKLGQQEFATQEPAISWQEYSHERDPGPIVGPASGLLQDVGIRRAELYMSKLQATGHCWEGSWLPDELHYVEGAGYTWWVQSFLQDPTL